MAPAVEFKESLSVLYHGRELKEVILFGLVIYNLLRGSSHLVSS